MAKGKGFGGFGGGMNMQAMMKQAQKMQESMLKAQEEIAQMESTGTAGGGMVAATVTGTSTLKSIAIKPDVVDPDDIDMLQDLVVAAVNEALKAASDKSQSQMSAITAASAAVWAVCCNGVFAPPVERLIEEFAKLPGIGLKTAQRLVFHVLDLPKEDAERFADAIREAKAKTFTCRRCQNLTDSEICPICSGQDAQPEGDLRGGRAARRNCVRAHEGVQGVCIMCCTARCLRWGTSDRTTSVSASWSSAWRRRRPRRLSSPPIRHRGRSHGDVHFAAAAAVRHQDYAAGVWYSGWRASGVC